MQASGMLIEKIHQSGDDLVSLDREERRLIYQWQQFAADMERLMPHMPGFWIEKGVCRCAFDAVAGDASVRTIVNGADYYSAARKAVEALEKGE